MIAMTVPCFNEERRFDLNYWRALLDIEDACWIFVDDGSTDKTLTLLHEVGPPPLVTVISLSSNIGKAEAVRMGMLNVLARTSTVEVNGLGFIDADGAFAHDDILAVLCKHSQLVNEGRVDATWSARVRLAGRNIQREAARHYLGRSIATLLSLGIQNPPYDTQSGLKIFFRQPELIAVLSRPFRTRWLFEWEMLIRWRQIVGQSMRIWEEPLNSWQEVSGSKSLTGREAMRIAKELLVIKGLQRALKRNAMSSPTHRDEGG